jgi:hypothetical protein
LYEGDDIDLETYRQLSDALMGLFSTLRESTARGPTALSLAPDPSPDRLRADALAGLGAGIAHLPEAQRPSLLADAMLMADFRGARRTITEAMRGGASAREAVRQAVDQFQLTHAGYLRYMQQFANAPGQR